MPTVSNRYQIIKAPGVDEIHLAHRLFGEQRVVEILFLNERGNQEKLHMTVSGSDHEDGSGKSLIVRGYALNSMTSERRVNGQIQFWTRDSTRRGWIQIPFLI